MIVVFDKFFFVIATKQDVKNESADHVASTLKRKILIVFRSIYDRSANIQTKESERDKFVKNCVMNTSIHIYLHAQPVHKID